MKDFHSLYFELKCDLIWFKFAVTMGTENVKIQCDL